MYPSFQKLNGNLISLNGFENPLPADPVPSKIVRDYAPTGSGKVRYVCYPTLGSTNFYLGDINTIVGSPQGIQFSTDQMTVAAISAAPLGESFINVPGSVVFLNTIPLGTGVYRIAARNNKTNYPMTTVESGIISQWPKPKDISDETFFANVSTSYHGYEVFNNAFWVTDWGAFINNSIGVSDFDPVGPSGFSIHSPFTGRPLWQRNSTSALAAVISNDLSVPANNSNTNWTQNLLSLNRTGVDSIVRLAGLSPGSFIGGVSFDIIIAIYNDLINSVSNITTTLSLSPTNINSNTTKVYSMVWDGNHHWVIGESTAVIGPQRFVWELDATFSEVARYDSSLAPLLFNRTGAISDGLGGPIRYFQFEDTSLNISEWIPGGGVITTGSTKAIDINSIIPGTVVNSEICSILEVNGISELDSGAYALIRVRTNLANNRFYIVRIEEGLTTWNVRGLWFIKNLPLDFNLEQVSTLLPDKRMGMIVMPIN
jgi:hypothetical protein